MWLHQQEGGRANYYRFESWYPDPYAVLPETQAGTYTHLALSAIKYMKGIKDTNGTLEQLNLGLAALGATNVISITNNGDVACLPAITVTEAGTSYLVARYFNSAGADITAQIQSAEGYCHTNMLQPGQSTTITQFVGAVAGATTNSARSFSFEVFWNPQDPTGIVRDRKSVTVTGANISASNPVAWYKFDNNANDSSGNALNLTLAGNPSYTTGCLSQALVLSGSSQTATAGYNSLFALNSYSVSVWLYLTNYPAVGAGYSFFSTRTAANTYGFDLQIYNPSGTPYVHGDVGTGSSWINTSADMPGITPSLNAWHQITYVVDNGGKLISLYFDGSLQNTYTIAAGSTPLFMKSNQTLQLLGSSGGAYRLDDARIYGSALNGGQVAALAVLVPANTAPTLNAISNCTLIAGQTLTFTNVASDPDAPPQTLTFSLLSAPSGATVNATNGIFSWRPTISQSPTTNQISVTVTDNGVPPLGATQSFSVMVLKPANPVLSPASATFSNGVFSLRVNGDPGPNYSILASTNLTVWTNVFTATSPSLPFVWNDTNTANLPRRFYRVVLGP